MEFCEDPEVKKKNREIILEIALLINNKLFEQNLISYMTFIDTENNILKQIKDVGY